MDLLTRNSVYINLKISIETGKLKKLLERHDNCSAVKEEIRANIKKCIRKYPEADCKKAISHFVGERTLNEIEKKFKNVKQPL